MSNVAGRDLVLSELALLAAILARRDPDLIPIIERIGEVPLTEEQRDRIRRVVVDELCELPDGEGGRKALALEDLLIHLGGV